LKQAEEPALSADAFTRWGEEDAAFHNRSVTNATKLMREKVSTAKYTEQPYTDIRGKPHLLLTGSIWAALHCGMS
jgi:hypothetical protein